MSDDEKPDPSTTPSWQTSTATPLPAENTKEKATTDKQEEGEQTAETTIAISTTSSTEQEKLLELVNKFLQDPNVQHASIDKKMSFLTSKGLSKEQAEKALSTQEPSSTRTPATPSPLPQDVAASKPTAQLPSATSQPPPQTPQQPQHQANSNPIPPIITYPESLLPSTTSPPLITPARLTTFAYALSTIAATIYGTSTYLINPMLAALHSARHDFATHAQSNIDALNSKLSSIVSDDPDTKPQNEAEDEDDDDGIAAKALFTTTQPTTDPHSAVNSMTTTSSSSSASSSNQVSGAPITNTNTSTTSSPSHPNTHAENEIASLTKLHTHLSTTHTSQHSQDSTNDDVRKAVRDLNDYLISLASSAYTGSSYYGGNIYGGGSGKDKDKEAEKKNDEIANVKKEIRGIKGMFVSGRKFPVPSVRR